MLSDIGSNEGGQLQEFRPVIKTTMQVPMSKQVKRTAFSTICKHPGVFLELMSVQKNGKHLSKYVTKLMTGTTPDDSCLTGRDLVSL